MKYLRQFCITIILVFALTGVALADDGIIHPWPPAPTPPSTTSENTINDATTSVQADDPVLDVALDLAQLALGRL